MQPIIVEKVINQLKPIFCNVFDDEALKIDIHTSAQDVDAWDSLSHIRLIISIEKALGLRFSAGEIADLKNVGEMAQLILKKQANI